ncbi:hypothetical protein BDV59DRAFT_4770 [Aspergillus ambiguus]|uniref:uncharacterized protein n=1 Tax=Aspergillus ambiguus TaxID=176160 RepID=UPI003CCD24B7
MQERRMVVERWNEVETGELAWRGSPVRGRGANQTMTVGQPGEGVEDRGSGRDLLEEVWREGRSTGRDMEWREGRGGREGIYIDGTGSGCDHMWRRIVVALAGAGGGFPGYRTVPAYHQGRSRELHSGGITVTPLSRCLNGVLRTYTGEMPQREKHSISSLPLASPGFRQFSSGLGTSSPEE